MISTAAAVGGGDVVVVVAVVGGGGGGGDVVSSLPPLSVGSVEKPQRLVVIADERKAPGIFFETGTAIARQPAAEAGTDPDDTAAMVAFRTSTRVPASIIPLTL